MTDAHPAPNKSLLWGTRLLFLLPLPLFGFAVGTLFATLAASSDLPKLLIPLGGLGAVAWLGIAGRRDLRKPQIIAGDPQASWSQLAKLVLGAGAVAGLITFLVAWTVVLGFRLTDWGEEGVAVAFVSEFAAISGAGPIGTVLFWRKLASGRINAPPGAPVRAV